MQDLKRIEHLLIDLGEENISLWEEYVGICRREGKIPSLLHEYCEKRYKIELSSDKWDIKIPPEDIHIAPLGLLDFSVFTPKNIFIRGHSSLETLSLPEMKSVDTLTFINNSAMNSVDLNIPNARMILITGNTNLKHLKIKSENCHYLWLDPHHIDCDLFLNDMTVITVGNVTVPRKQHVKTDWEYMVTLKSNLRLVSDSETLKETPKFLMKLGVFVFFLVSFILYVFSEVILRHLFEE